MSIKIVSTAKLEGVALELVSEVDHEPAEERGVQESAPCYAHDHGEALRGYHHEMLERVHGELVQGET